MNSGVIKTSYGLLVLSSRVCSRESESHPSTPKRPSSTNDRVEGSEETNRIAGQRIHVRTPPTWMRIVVHLHLPIRTMTQTYSHLATRM